MPLNLNMKVRGLGEHHILPIEQLAEVNLNSPLDPESQVTSSTPTCPKPNSASLQEVRNTVRQVLEKLGHVVSRSLGSRVWIITRNAITEAVEPVQTYVYYVAT